MTPITKARIKTFSISGLIYGGLMAGDNYLEGNEFNIWKFLLHVFIFGIIMAFVLNKNKSQNKDSILNK